MMSVRKLTALLAVKHRLGQESCYYKQRGKEKAARGSERMRLTVLEVAVDDENYIALADEIARNCHFQRCKMIEHLDLVADIRDGKIRDPERCKEIIAAAAKKADEVRKSLNEADWVIDAAKTAFWNDWQPLTA
jgi:hypothetical protein